MTSAHFRLKIFDDTEAELTSLREMNIEVL